MILVVGSGGNGQTYFMEFLKLNKLIINHVHDADKLKHLYSPDKMPKIIKPTITKCIFLYSHPYSSLLSHYRRGWEKFQIPKLGNPFDLSEDGMKYPRYKKNVLRHNKDMFGIEYQFNNWITANQEFPVLFLDFNEVLKKKALINLFLETELDYSLFQQKERNCKIDKSRICKIYTTLYRNMEESVLKRPTHLSFKDQLFF